MPLRMSTRCVPVWATLVILSARINLHYGLLEYNVRMARRSLLFLLSAAMFADDAQRLLRVDHYIRVKSVAPSMTGQISQVYVREVVKAGTALRGAAGVVLFIHGAGT